MEAAAGRKLGSRESLGGRIMTMRGGEEATRMIITTGETVGGMTITTNKKGVLAILYI